jgi:hypothetical protein
MTYHFTLQLTRIECLNEQMHEPGQDEMRILGFGIGRKTPPPFAIGFRSFGGFHEGDVKTSGVVPQTWFEADLQDDGLEILLYMWLVEEDSGGVRGHASEIETTMQQSYRDHALKLVQSEFPRECIPFTAFYRAIPTVQAAVSEAATDGINNDELYTPWDLLLRHEGASGTDFSKDQILEMSKDGGHYRLTLSYGYTYMPGLKVGGDVAEIFEGFEA